MTKKNWQRILGWWVLIFALILVSPPAIARAASVTLNKVQTSVYKGKTVQLYPTSGVATNWKSNKPKIATVSSTGLVTGIKKGTCTISCKVDGKTLKCTMNVRKKTTSKYVANKYSTVWKNLLGAVESGGMVYGKRNYAAFAGPGASSPNEYSCTAGAYQEYGDNLRDLLKAILKQYPISFRGRDTQGIEEDIARPWTDRNPYTVGPGSAKAKCIQAIISCNAGAFVQDLRAVELLDEYLTEIKKMGITNLRCGMFMAECYHLGGLAPVKRVVNRCQNPNNLSELRTSLYQDQKDKTSSYQIGDTFYQNRHETIYRWLEEYIPVNAKF